MLEVQVIPIEKTTNSILLDIQKIQRYCGTPIAAVYGDNLLRNMRIIRDEFPSEPLTEVIVALYDAIAFQNRWIDYSPNQYKGVHHLLTTLLQKQLSNSDAEEAILTLENLGFDTLPFGVEFNTDIDNNGWEE